MVLGRFFALATLLAVTTASADNVVNNGCFDSDKTGWTSIGGNLVWHPVDALGLPGSGSISMTVPSGNTFVTATQCVPVTPGGTYDLAAKIMIPGQQAKAVGNVWLNQFASTDCSGTQNPGTGTPTVSDSSNGRFTSVALRKYTLRSDSRSAQVKLQLTQTQGGVTGYFDDVTLTPSGGCVPDDNALCLSGGRFEVKATYRAPDAVKASGAHVVQLTADSGYMWFFDKNNVEVTIKVLDACSIGPAKWVFAAGMTDVEVTIQVTDTVTKAVQTYRNAVGHRFETTLDTNAFGCP